MLVNPPYYDSGHGYQCRPLKNGAADSTTGRVVVTKAYNTRDSLRSLIMLEITLKLDEDVLSALRRSPDEFANEMRLAAAIS